MESVAGEIYVPLTRLSVARQSNDKLYQGLRFKLAKHVTLLHRAEICLADSMEWDFALALVSQDEYAFLHIYTSMVTQYEDSMGFGEEYVTFPQVLDVLNTSLETLKLVQGKIALDPSYRPETDPEAEAIMNRLPKKFRPLFGLVPQVMVQCAQDGVKAGRISRYEVETWIVSALEKSIDTLDYANKLLLQRGLGDRQ